MHASPTAPFVVRLLIICAIVLGVMSYGSQPAAAEGTLFIIGGGLKASNTRVLERMINTAGGKEHCRAAVFRTASASIDAAKGFATLLQKYGVEAERIDIIDIHPGNAATAAHDPEQVHRVGACNLIYFTGGVQERITQSLLTPEGKDTPVLAAVRQVLARGGVLAGSSAGAAMQSRTMISVGGLPNEAIDEGMDALDFGLSQHSQRRGLAVRSGLGFFSPGIIDQHFGQYRGRVGRLSRAVVEQKVGYGFGIDENTALIVTSDGFIEVSGEGYLTVIDGSAARLADGPLGCELRGLKLSCFASGDRFHPASGELRLPKGKVPLQVNADRYRGTFVIPDMSGEGALARALMLGLADNTAKQQVGLTLRYSQNFGHGYRCTFRKTKDTQAWGGDVDDAYRYAVRGVSLDIEPILSSLQTPANALPIDLPSDETRTACQGAWFRGILLTDAERRLHPTAPITRGDFAIALTQSVHLLPPLGEHPPIADVPDDSPYHDAVTRVLEAKLLKLDSAGHFHPSEAINREDAAYALQRLAIQNGSTLTKLPLVGDRAADPMSQRLTRQEVAALLCQILDFPWCRP